MAAACRSAATAVMANGKSLGSHPNSLLRSLSASKPIPTSPLSSSTSRAASRVVVAAMGGVVESMMPLHSAIASARLRSSIALDSSCWSFLSQGILSPIIVSLG